MRRADAEPMPPRPDGGAPAIRLGRDVCGAFERAVTREWLVTNGLGGFASGTVSDVNTRRYHGLLVAALSPPVRRTLLVAKMDAYLRRGRDTYALCSNEFTDGAVIPHGYSLLSSFAVEDGVPVWRYAAGDSLIERRILMAAGRNITYLEFALTECSGTVDVELVPLCGYRDYHAHGRAGPNPALRFFTDGFQVDPGGGAHPYRVQCRGAVFTPGPRWHCGFKHREETARGLDDREDLFRPGTFSLRLEKGQTATVSMGVRARPPRAGRRRPPQGVPADALPGDAPGWIRQLAVAAGQFLVRRSRRGRGPADHTVIAGYPWFTDWGRDTMIALPGLTLATGRLATAAAILRGYAGYLSQGMLPNRFADADEAPAYNTVDATLWFFHALFQHLRAGGDASLAGELYPALRDIIAWHRRGTRYGIGVDPQDGLLRAGEPGVQLTWMDAKAGDWVVTPRHGKPVEVNALWYNALRFMADWAAALGDHRQAADYRQMADRAGRGFRRFWNQRRGCLYDVIDGPPDQPAMDGRLRPNQLLAVSLPHSPLDAARQRAVVQACEHALLTPRGLRSLAPGEPGYAARYEGDRLRRDGAYHQGTVWAWLIGPFVDAHLRVHGDAGRALSFVEPFGDHLAEACVGSISEIFDAEPPFTPRGCFAQAWSVAEVLRAWLQIRRHR